MIITQMFQWSFAAVAAECPTLSELGFTHVQTSPVIEHITGDAWWTSYQPVSLKVESKLGHRADFASMVKTCKDSGVSILADVVWNHMTGSDTSSGKGVNGSSWTGYDFPAVPYTEADFHTTACPFADGQIDNADDATQVYDCQLSHLRDLDTTSANLSLGVAGFRLDAAKYIEPADLKAIVAKLDWKPVIVQEVYPGGASSPIDYTSIGLVNNFNYSGAALDFVKTKGSSRAPTLTKSSTKTTSTRTSTTTTRRTTTTHRSTVSVPSITFGHRQRSGYNSRLR